MKGDIYKTIIIRDENKKNSKKLKPYLFGTTNKIRTAVLRECYRFHNKYGDYDVTNERAQEFNLLPTGKRPKQASKKDRNGKIYDKKNIEQLYNKTQAYKRKLDTDLTQVTLMLTAHAVGDEFKGYVANKKQYDSLVNWWEKKCENAMSEAKKSKSEYVEPRKPFLLEYIYKNKSPLPPRIKPKNSYRLLAIPGKRCHFVEKNKIYLDKTGVTIDVPFNLFQSEDDVVNYLRYVRIIWNRGVIEYHITFRITEESKKRYSYQFNRMDIIKLISGEPKKIHHFGLDMGENKYLTCVSTNPKCPSFYIPTDDIILHNIRYYQRIESIKESLPEGVKKTKKLHDIYLWDKEFKKTWAHKIVARVLDVCLYYGAKTLTIGIVKRQKERFSKKRNNFESNMCFYMIPHSLVLKYLEEMSPLYGIEFETVFERQSSLISSIDGELGIRQDQESLRLPDGSIVNPDVNGAINHIKWRFGERIENEEQVNYSKISNQFIGGIKSVLLNDKGEKIDPVPLNVSRRFEGFKKNRYYHNLHKKSGVLDKERKTFLSFSRNRGLQRK